MRERQYDMQLELSPRNTKKDTYVLRMTEEEANTAFLAFELLARVTMGQIENIADYARLRELQNMPDLRRALSTVGSTYLQHQGATSLPDYGKQAWDLYQVLRYEWYWNMYPKGGRQVWFDEPMPVSSHLPTAMVERNEKP